MTGFSGPPDRAGRGGSTSRGLLSDARHDDPAAWTRLVHLYAPLVAVWCRRGGIAEQDIADLLQDVFAAVARGLIRFHKTGPHGTFRGWLATITRNKVRDYYRQRADRPAAVGGTEAAVRLTEAADPQPFVPDATDERDETDDTDQAAFSAVLQRALASIQTEFQPRTWRAFWEVVVEGRSTADVAAELAMKPGAVRVSKSRVLSRLRRELGDVP